MILIRGLLPCLATVYASRMSKPAAANNVAVARLRQMKRIVNGPQTNLQALAKTGALQVGDEQLESELTALAQTLSTLQEQFGAARAQSVTIVAEATTRLSEKLTHGVAFTLSRAGVIEARFT